MFHYWSPPYPALPPLNMSSVTPSPGPHTCRLRPAARSNLMIIFHCRTFLINKSDDYDNVSISLTESLLVMNPAAEDILEELSLGLSWYFPVPNCLQEPLKPVCPPSLYNSSHCVDLMKKHEVEEAIIFHVTWLFYYSIYIIGIFPHCSSSCI